MPDLSAPADPKPGIRTTEFWGKTILQAVLLLNALFDLGIQVDDATAVTIAAGAEALYNVWRGYVKSRTVSIKS